MKPEKVLFTLAAMFLLVVFVCVAQTVAKEKKKEDPKAAVRQSGQSLSGGLKPTKEETVSVYCCEDGRLVQDKMTKDELKKNADTCSDSRLKAERFCDVYCCVDGEVKKISSDECRKNRGDEFGSSSEAKRKCQPADVYCCVDGEVKRLSPDECRKNKGEEFESSFEAKRKCEPADIYCCLDGKVQKMDGRECAGRKGRSFSTRKMADKECASRETAASGITASVWCCLDGKVSRMLQGQCVKAMGHPFAKHDEAVLECKGASSLRKISSGSPKGREKPFARQKLEMSSHLTTSAERDAVRVMEEPGTMSMNIPGPAYPARITGIGGDLRPGGTIIIFGEDFGYRQGRVRLWRGLVDQMVPFAEILEWSEEEVTAIIPAHFDRGLCESALRSRLQVWPAAVADGPAPLSIEGEEAADEWAGYHYSGTEGPMYLFDLLPNEPVIRSVSPDEILYNGEALPITVRGSHFGSAGAQVRLHGGGEEYQTFVEGQNDNRITFHITSISAGVMAAGEYEVGVTVQNCGRSVSGPAIRFATMPTVTFARLFEVDPTPDADIDARRNRDGDRVITDEQQTAIEQAEAQAERNAIAALAVLDGIWGQPGSGSSRRDARKAAWRADERVVLWFGEDELTNEQIRVTRYRMRQIRDEFDGGLSFDIVQHQDGDRSYLCEPNVGAYCSPGTPIKLCPEWFDYDSNKQAWVIIHELSHKNGHVHHSASGSGPAQTLARDNPSLARRNPENYAGFSDGFR